MGGSVQPAGGDGGDGATGLVLRPDHAHPAVPDHPGGAVLPLHPGEEEGGWHPPAQRQDGAHHRL